MDETIIKIIIHFLLILCKLILAESQCGDWQHYGDIKCFKIYESSGLQTYDDAINTCRAQNNDSNLVTINSADEQSFLTTFIFKTKEVVDNVWIGVRYVNSQYKWLNGLNLTYTNWFEGHPKNLSDYCVEMHSDVDSMGKWVDESCKRKNLVVCERLITWSLTDMQQTVLRLLDKVNNLEKAESNLQLTVTDLKKNEANLIENIASFKQNNSFFQQTILNLSEKISILEKNESKLEETVKIQQEKLSVVEKNASNLQLTVGQLNDNISMLKQSEDNLKNIVTNLKINETLILEASNLKHTLIPFGFIYVQFPSEKTPQEIWSWMTWTEITSSYAGLFFRAFGGNSSSFGSTQEANAPRITEIKIESNTDHSGSGHVLSTYLIEGEWSKWLYSGGNIGSYNIDWIFHTSGGEVRPRNTAIRIWKRFA